MLFRPELRMVEPLMSAPALVPAIGRLGDHQADHGSGAPSCRAPLRMSARKRPIASCNPARIAQHTNLPIHKGSDLLQCQMLTETGRCRLAKAGEGGCPVDGQIAIL